MTRKNSILNLLGLIFILIGCEKDNLPPSVDLNIVEEKEAYFNGDVLNLEYSASDNKELQMLSIIVSIDAQTKQQSILLDGTSATGSISFDLDFDVDGDINILYEIQDLEGNTHSDEIIKKYRFEEGGSLDINIKLEYRGEPLVMFTDYQYPDGRTINFTRFSFYTSLVMLDDVEIQEIEFHNLTNNNAVPENAATGFTWTINCIPPGEYNQFSFSIGVPENLNELGPSDFTSSHPLSRSSEHWFSWDSYIFCKVEGNLDSNEDGEKDTPIALHLGSNDAFRSTSFEQNISIVAFDTTEVKIVLDLYDFFGGDQSIFDIDNNPQIHNLSQIPAIEELAENLINNIIFQ